MIPARTENRTNVVARAKKAVPREKERRIGPPDRSEAEVSIADGDGKSTKYALESRYPAAKVHGVLPGREPVQERRVRFV